MKVEYPRELLDLATADHNELTKSQFMELVKTSFKFGYLMAIPEDKREGVEFRSSLARPVL